MLRGYIEQSEVVFVNDLSGSGCCRREDVNYL